MGNSETHIIDLMKAFHGWKHPGKAQPYANAFLRKLYGTGNIYHDENDASAITNTPKESLIVATFWLQEVNMKCGQGLFCVPPIAF